METSSESNSRRRRSVNLPGSRASRISVAIAIALMLAGILFFDGSMAGVLGLWGLSLLAVTVVGDIAYRLWYHYGS
ncbi:hypothetical protein [Natrinema sp. SYSU A 869]|uniref:hypothetical protein n=1 Tax=Natrinema sp. SYSU A 869 TaxID=2871694 RepID=UPI00210308FC|nr:hypothetical protein [Natrinema sp. SYSU A 869]